MSILSEISQRAIVELRERLGITQKALSERLRVTNTTVARWETSHPPPAHVCAKLGFLAEQAGHGDLAHRFLTYAFLEIVLQAESEVNGEPVFQWLRSVPTIEKNYIKSRSHELGLGPRSGSDTTNEVADL